VRQRSVAGPVAAAALDGLGPQFATLDSETLTEMRENAGAAERASLARRLRLKVAGADTSLAVEWQPGATLALLRQAFDELHARHFGFRAEAAVPLIVESLETEAIAPSGGTPACGATVAGAMCPCTRAKRCWPAPPFAAPL
jgi:N-methylhydantoinase A/oxoprolinase/acetone carboxylase beta subunit